MRRLKLSSRPGSRAEVPSRPGTLLALVGVLGSACTLEIVDTLIGNVDQAAGETGQLDAGVDVGDSGDNDGGGGETGQGDEDGGPPLPLFDIGGGEVQVTSCEFAAEFPSHLGCEFFGIDVDGPGLFDFEPFGFVVINPLPDPVEVKLERYNGRSWALVDAATVERAHTFMPAHNQALGTGLHSGANLRITSEHPIVVVQSHAAIQPGISASATMLQPTTAWSSRLPIAGWRTHPGVGERAYLAVIARSPATPVILRPLFEVADSPAQWADHWIDLDNDDEPELVLALEPGELLRFDAGAIDAAEVDHGTSGSTVDSGHEHLTSAFSAHTCAAIPDYDGTCGHLQEQLSAALIGERFIAPRMIAIDLGDGSDPVAPMFHERTMIQVVATESQTEIVFGYHDGLGGVELETVIIDPDEPYAVYESERDLAIVADKPIICAAYMTNAQLTHFGSPSMVQLAPINQWTGHHWVWVPDGFETHLLISASPTASVTVQWLAGLAADDQPGSATELEATLVAAPGGQPRVVRRFVVDPGIYRVQSSGPSSVVVAGWRHADGFAYLGGWGPSFADLGPEG